MPDLWDLVRLVGTFRDITKIIVDECDIEVVIDEKSKTFRVTAYLKGTKKMVLNVIIQTNIKELSDLIKTIINTLKSINKENKA